MAEEECTIIEREERIPIFKSWRQWYIFLILWLALLIILFYLFTKQFS